MASGASEPTNNGIAQAVTIVANGSNIETNAAVANEHDEFVGIDFEVDIDLFGLGMFAGVH